MGDDGIASVHHGGIVAPLVEQTHVDAQHRAVEDVAVDRSLIGADDHQMIAVDLQIALPAEQRLENLIAGLYAVKADQGDGVLHARVVRIEGDDVAHAHLLQLLQRQGAVQAFAAGAAMLAALIEHGHDDVDALGAAADGRDDALEVLIVIVGGHGHFTPIHLISDVVSSDVGQDVDVVAAHAVFDHSLALARAKTGAVRLNQEIVPVGAHQGKERGVLQGFLLLVPFHEPVVDLLPQFLAARHGDQPQGRERHGQKVVVPRAYKVRHRHTPSQTNVCRERQNQYTAN